jgi:hypothetical protein
MRSLKSASAALESPFVEFWASLLLFVLLVNGILGTNVTGMRIEECGPISIARS